MGGDIALGGTLVLGNDQNSLGGGFVDSGSFPGQIAEVILLDIKASDLERQKVLSYLSLKYGIELLDSAGLPTDLLDRDGAEVWDKDLDTNYPHNAFGLFADDLSYVNDGGTVANTSATARAADDKGRIILSNPSHLEGDWGNAEYLILSASTNTTVTAVGTELSRGVVERTDREWLVQETGDIGTFDVTLSFTGASYSGTTIDDFYLMKHTQGDFTAGSTPTGIPATGYTGSSVTFAGVDLNTGDYLAVSTNGINVLYPTTITATASATENPDSTATLTIDLGAVNTTPDPITVNYTITSTATNGTDYSGPVSGSVDIGVGSQTSDLVFDTTGFDDLIIEGDETITVTIDSLSEFSARTVTGFEAGVVTLIDDEDEDNDGISTVIEDGGFNSGDGNGDGIQDSTQTNVAGVPNPVTGVYTTIVADGGTSTCPAIAAVQMLAESSLATQSNNYDFPTGLVDYTFDCGTNIGGDADISLYYTEQLDTSSYGLVEFDDTTNIFTDVFASASASFANEVLVSGPQAGLTVTKANFKITDGGVLDNDGSANGVITHKVGPSIALNLLSSSSGGGSSTRTSLFGITSQPKIDTSQAGLIEDLAVFLYYDQELDATRLPDPADFLVTLENGITIIPESVVIAKNTVILTLPQSIPPDLEVYLSYTGEHEGIYVEGKYRAASSFELVAIANITESLLLSPGQGSDVDSIIYSGLVCEPYFGVNLQRGAEGDSVRQLQTFLKGVQLYVGTIDGKYGPATTQAVSNFQETYRRFVLEPLSLTNSTGQWSVLTRLMGNFILCQLEATGRTDLRIQSVTQNAPTQSTACPRFTAFLQRGKQNSIQAVQSVQLFLNEYTDAQLVPDGVLGSGTQATIEQFQQTYIDQLPGRRIDGIWGGNSQKVANGLVGC
jgi:hypothetical protein